HPLPAPSQTPSEHFCALLPISGIFPCPYREKTRLMISSRLHGYAYERMDVILAAKIRRAP
ncbi:hypothetical protein, partial [Escherichia coli]|uniref:hypothetical protein n=1 Tax=Escherichia coli TaxID=562 RepID=UPI001BFD898C